MDHACRMPDKWIRYVQRGWNPGRTRDWDLALIPRKKNWFGSFKTTSHSGPYGYLQNIPLIFFGPGYIRSTGPIRLPGETTLADLPATYAELMNFRFPSRAGSPITEVLRETSDRPRLIVTVVIDGGGWNVLNRWPHAWPRIKRLMNESASIEGAVVGSSPSITPAVHTTLSTGAFPEQHGVMAIVARSDGGSLVSGFASSPYEASATRADPTLTLDLTTLGDEWDLATGNRALVAMIASQNFHLGMLGHGSALAGADKDIAGMTGTGPTWATNRAYFSLPRYVNSEVEGVNRDLQAVDRADGSIDSQWRGHQFGRIDATPAYSAWQRRTMEAIISREGFGADEITDLFYINFKAPDAAGHQWNMIAPEQRDVLLSVDQAVAKTVRFLDRRVGRGNYVLVMTADHGQTPLDSGGWAINRQELRRDIEARFDRIDNGVGIIERPSTAIYFMNPVEMRSNGVSPERVASFISGYTIGDNVSAGSDLPEPFRARRGEKVFAAAIPGRQMRSLGGCAGEPRPGG